MRALIAAGGTGGHIYPGIAVAGEIMRRDRASIVTFVGTAHGLESRLVPESGFELSIIESAGLKNVSLGAKVRGLILLPKSFFAARRVIRDFRPGIVIGAGGYVSGPVLLAASFLRASICFRRSPACCNATETSPNLAASFDARLNCRASASWGVLTRGSNLIVNGCVLLFPFAVSFTV